jgi:hypothetical protein
MQASGPIASRARELPHSIAVAIIQSRSGRTDRCPHHRHHDYADREYRPWHKSFPTWEYAQVYRLLISRADVCRGGFALPS